MGWAGMLMGMGMFIRGSGGKGEGSFCFNLGMGRASLYRMVISFKVRGERIGLYQSNRNIRFYIPR